MTSQTHTTHIQVQTLEAEPFRPPVGNVHSIEAAQLSRAIGTEPAAERPEYAQGDLTTLGTERPHAEGIGKQNPLYLAVQGLKESLVIRGSRQHTGPGPLGRSIPQGQPVNRVVKGIGDTHRRIERTKRILS